MIVAAPSEKEATSWLWVVLWILVIFLTIPLAQGIRSLVSELWGRALFGHLTIVFLALASGAGIWNLNRRAMGSPSQYLWLSLTAVVYLGGTLRLRDAPEEALHLVQYGVLSILSYRALTHRVQDWSIYVLAAIISAIVGVADEAIQWLVPRRFWGLRDIGIDFLGAALAQVGIAGGLRPPLIARGFQPTGIRWVCRLGTALALMLAATLLNTPQRIAWYSERLPYLAFLNTNESVMFEYGYRYSDPETGPFKSRFSETELRRIDLQRGAEAGAILNLYRDHSLYRQFLETYTPVADPFVHEARVHLFRRDRNLELAEETRGDEEQRRIHLTVAFRENRIMEKYFSNTFRHSEYSLRGHILEEMRTNLLPESQLPRKEVVSGVSKHLVTVVREPQILLLLVLTATALIAVGSRLGVGPMQTAARGRDKATQ